MRIAIVGSDPTALCAALTLAEAGLAVTVLDPDPHPKSRAVFGTTLSAADLCSGPTAEGEVGWPLERRIADRALGVADAERLRAFRCAEASTPPSAGLTGASASERAATRDPKGRVHRLAERRTSNEHSVLHPLLVETLWHRAAAAGALLVRGARTLALRFEGGRLRTLFTDRGPLDVDLVLWTAADATTVLARSGVPTPRASQPALAIEDRILALPSAAIEARFGLPRDAGLCLDLFLRTPRSAGVDEPLQARAQILTHRDHLSLALCAPARAESSQALAALAEGLLQAPVLQGFLAGATLVAGGHRALHAAPATLAEHLAAPGLVLGGAAASLAVQAPGLGGLGPDLALARAFARLARSLASNGAESPPIELKSHWIAAASAADDPAPLELHAAAHAAAAPAAAFLAEQEEFFGRHIDLVLGLSQALTAAPGWPLQRTGRAALAAARLLPLRALPRFLRAMVAFETATDLRRALPRELPRALGSATLNLVRNLWRPRGPRAHAVIAVPPGHRPPWLVARFGARLTGGAALAVQSLLASPPQPIPARVRLAQRAILRHMSLLDHLLIGCFGFGGYAVGRLLRPFRRSQDPDADPTAPQPLRLPEKGAAADPAQRDPLTARGGEEGLQSHAALWWFAAREASAHAGPPHPWPERSSHPSLCNDAGISADLERWIHGCAGAATGARGRLGAAITAGDRDAIKSLCRSVHEALRAALAEVQQAPSSAHAARSTLERWQAELAAAIAADDDARIQDLAELLRAATAPAPTHSTPEFSAAPVATLLWSHAVRLPAAEADLAKARSFLDAIIDPRVLLGAELTDTPNAPELLSVWRSLLHAIGAGAVRARAIVQAAAERSPALAALTIDQLAVIDALDAQGDARHLPLIQALQRGERRAARVYGPLRVGSDGTLEADPALALAQGADFFLWHPRPEEAYAVAADHRHLRIRPCASAGLRGAGLATVELHGVPASPALPQKFGTRMLAAALTLAGARGIAASAAARAYEHASSRVQFAKAPADARGRQSIAKFGAVQGLLADIAAAEAELSAFASGSAPSPEALDLLLGRTGELLAPGPRSVTYAAGQVLGGRGIHRGELLAQAFRDGIAWRALVLRSDDALLRAGLRAARAPAEPLAGFDEPLGQDTGNAAMAERADLDAALRGLSESLLELDLETRRARALDLGRALAAAYGACCTLQAEASAFGSGRADPLLRAAKDVLVPRAIQRLWRLTRRIPGTRALLALGQKLLEPGAIEGRVAARGLTLADFAQTKTPVPAATLFQSEVSPPSLAVTPELIDADPEASAYLRGLRDRLRPILREEGQTSAEKLEALRQSGDLAPLLRDSSAKVPFPRLRYALLCAELARAKDPALAVILMGSATLATSPLASAAHNAAHTWFLARLAAGSIGAFALTEAQAGSDPHPIATRAVPERLPLWTDASGMLRFDDPVHGPGRRLVPRSACALDGQRMVYVDPAGQRHPIHSTSDEFGRTERWIEGPEGRWIIHEIAEPVASGEGTALEVFRLHGEKAWVTNGGRADLFTILARTEAGISAFVLDRAAEGLRVLPDEPRLGQEGAPANALVLDHVRVPADQAIGAPGAGLNLALEALDLGRGGLAVFATSLLQELALSAASAHRERPLAPHELLDLGRTGIDLGVASSLSHWLTGQLDHPLHRGLRTEAALAKVVATEALHRTLVRAERRDARNALEAHSLLARRRRDARVLTIYEGTNEVQRLLLARDLEPKRSPEPATPRAAAAATEPAATGASTSHEAHLRALQARLHAERLAARAAGRALGEASDLPSLELRLRAAALRALAVRESLSRTLLEPEHPDAARRSAWLRGALDLAVQDLSGAVEAARQESPLPIARLADQALLAAEQARSRRAKQAAAKSARPGSGPLRIAVWIDARRHGPAWIQKRHGAASGGHLQLAPEEADLLAAIAAWRREGPVHLMALIGGTAATRELATDCIARGADEAMIFDLGQEPAFAMDVVPRLAEFCTLRTMLSGAGFDLFIGLPDSEHLLGPLARRLGLPLLEADAAWPAFRTTGGPRGFYGPLVPVDPLHPSADAPTPTEPLLHAAEPHAPALVALWWPPHEDHRPDLASIQRAHREPPGILEGYAPVRPDLTVTALPGDGFAGTSLSPIKPHGAMSEALRTSSPPTRSPDAHHDAAEDPVARAARAIKDWLALLPTPAATAVDETEVALMPALDAIGPLAIVDARTNSDRAQTGALASAVHLIAAARASVGSGAAAPEPASLPLEAEAMLEGLDIHGTIRHRMPPSARRPAGLLLLTDEATRPAAVAAAGRLGSDHGGLLPLVWAVPHGISHAALADALAPALQTHASPILGSSSTRELLQHLHEALRRHGREIPTWEGLATLDPLHDPPLATLHRRARGLCVRFPLDLQASALFLTSPDFQPAANDHSPAPESPGPSNAPNDPKRRPRLLRPPLRPSPPGTGITSAPRQDAHLQSAEVILLIDREPGPEPLRQAALRALVTSFERRGARTAIAATRHAFELGLPLDNAHLWRDEGPTLKARLLVHLGAPPFATRPRRLAANARIQACGTALVPSDAHHLTPLTGTPWDLAKALAEALDADP